MSLEFTVQTKIKKPVADVFDAVHSPEKLSRYFTTGGSSGPLEEGKTVIWRFEDYPEDVEVKVRKVVENERIVLEWESAERGYNTKVLMTFEAVDDRRTLLSISESGWRDTEEGRKASYQNCEGWTQMSASLKAWLEHGVILREGYY
ncbi:MAG: SRPBCC domain-containing protein [Thermoanaerobaculia bacterium]|nr:SRPBCC domain-containing protein [Thermoanaerobaculia bacterium]